MNNFLKHRGPWLGLILVMLLAACNLPGADTEAPTISPAATVASGEGTINFELGPGTRVLWADQSYVVYVPAGEFLMGNDETTTSDHTPAHTVTLAGFWIHQTEVTNQMYAACVEAGICSLPDQDADGPYNNSRYANHPVVNVDWNQAETYCGWILGRLPTEAEWEKAARGTEGDPYPWGDDTPACELLNAGDCLDPSDTSAVRDYLLGASPYDLTDTAGNVFEWVRDWYGEDFYASSPAENPTGPAEGTERVFRGSGYQTPVDLLQVYLRNHLDPRAQQDDLGFRCILTEETVANPPPPACETVGYEPPVYPGDDPTPTPAPYQVNAYCQFVLSFIPGGDGYRAQINIPFGYPVDPNAFTVTSPLGDVVCSVDPAFPDVLTCNGPGLPQSSTVEITICSALGAPPLPDVQPSCPAGYYWNEVVQRCRSNLRPSIDADCGPGYFQTDNYGCVPLAGGINADECPVGFGSATTIFEGHEKHICVPTDGDAYCEDNPGCSSNQTCIVGSYNTEEGCCELPEDVHPYCPVGYHYNGFLDLCMWEGSGDTNCITQTVSLPACETLTPPPQQVPCSSYTDIGSCGADPRCQWHMNVTTPGGYCETKP